MTQRRPCNQRAEQADRCAKAVNLGVFNQLPAQKLQIFQRAAAQKIVVGVRLAAQAVVVKLDPNEEFTVLFDAEQLVECFFPCCLLLQK